MPTFTIRNFRNETPSPSTRVDYIGGTITSIFRAERREKKRNKRVLREEKKKKSRLLPVSPARSSPLYNDNATAARTDTIVSVLQSGESKRLHREATSRAAAVVIHLTRVLP